MAQAESQEFSSFPADDLTRLSNMKSQRLTGRGRTMTIRVNRNRNTTLEPFILTAVHIESHQFHKKNHHQK